MSIIKISLDESLNINRSQEVEYERRRAIADILHTNDFICDEIKPPYYLTLSLDEGYICFLLENTENKIKKQIRIPIFPFKKLIKDYFIVCENYYNIAKTGSYLRIEAIDMGRKSLHDEAASLLMKRFLKYNIKTDLQTARRLFTLICVLHIRIMY